MRTLSIALLCGALWTPAAQGAADEPVASAAAQDFDARVFAGVAAQAEALPDVRSLVALRRGRVAFEYHRSGQDRVLHKRAIDRIRVSIQIEQPPSAMHGRSHIAQVAEQEFAGKVRRCGPGRPR